MPRFQADQQNLLIQKISLMLLKVSMYNKCHVWEEVMKTTNVVFLLLYAAIAIFGIWTLIRVIRRDLHRGE